MNIMKKMMFSCKEACRMISLSRDKELAWHQKIRLAMHLSMCKFCTRHQKQFNMFHDTIKKYQEEDSSITLTEEAKDKIKKLLKKNR